MGKKRKDRRDKSRPRGCVTAAASNLLSEKHNEETGRNLQTKNLPQHDCTSINNLSKHDATSTKSRAFDEKKTNQVNTATTVEGIPATSNNCQIISVDAENVKASAKAEHKSCSKSSKKKKRKHDSKSTRKDDRDAGKSKEREEEKGEATAVKGRPKKRKLKHSPPESNVEEEDLCQLGHSNGGKFILTPVSTRRVCFV